MKLTLTQNAYCSGSYLRLPTEDGEPSVFVLQGSWFEAPAVDADGNDYTVYWDILDDWDSDDAGDACDWDHPTAVVREDPWRDVAALVEEVIL